MMKKRFSLLFAALLVFSCGRDAGNDAPYAVAHRGCWLMDGTEFYINENCPAGVRMADRYGYPAIECDVRYTRDSVMVLMHDATINRTMRMASDYSPIPEPVKVSDCTFEELRTRYVLASTDPSLRTPIPTLQELLETCRETGIIPMLHSAIVESYQLAHEMLGDQFIAFDSKEEAVSQARNYSSCLILLDPGKESAAGTLERLQGIGGRCGMSTMNYHMLDSAYIHTVKNAGHQVQASIFPAHHTLRATGDGVTIQLSDFYWHQTQGRKAIASLKKKGLSLSEGESFTWTEQAPAFSAITMDLDFTGSLEVSFCGKTYTLTHEEWHKPENFGLRLFKSNPEVCVKALGTADIKSLKIKLYAI